MKTLKMNKYVVASYHNSDTYNYPENGLYIRKVFDNELDAKKFVKKDIYTTSHKLFKMISDAKFSDVIKINDMSWEFIDNNHDVHKWIIGTI